MYQEITFSRFCDAFQGMGRGDSFSYKGLRALFDFLEETDGESELDVIGLCGRFSEYSNALEAAQEFGYEESDELIEDADEEQSESCALDWLRANTAVIEFDGGVIVEEF